MPGGLQPGTTGPLDDRRLDPVRSRGPDPWKGDPSLEAGDLLSRYRCSVGFTSKDQSIRTRNTRVIWTCHGCVVAQTERPNPLAWQRRPFLVWFGTHPHARLGLPLPPFLFDGAGVGATGGLSPHLLRKWVGALGI